MIKKHLKTIIITSVITLAPMIVGIFLWDKLPDPMPIHFDIHNQPDGYGSKALAVFGIPLIMLAMHITCIFATKIDPKESNINEKVFTIVLFTTPAISLLVCSTIYPLAMGKDVPMSIIITLFVGLVFVIIGNYLPKCKQSYTIGIKLPWTLEDSENWSKTHSLAGKLWVICGLIIMATAFLENPYIFLPVVVIMVLVPTAYSFLLYKKKKDKSE